MTLFLAALGFCEWYEGVGIMVAVFLATFVATYRCAAAVLPTETARNVVLSRSNPYSCMCVCVCVLVT